MFYELIEEILINLEPENQCPNCGMADVDYPVISTQCGCQGFNFQE